jgi:hypothetical protein
MEFLPLYPRIRAVELAGPFALRLGFEDGTSGIVDLGPLVLGGGEMFEPLRDPAYFARVFVDHDAGTVAWPNGLDLDPDVLYARAHGIPVPGYEE